MRKRALLLVFLLFFPFNTFAANIITYYNGADAHNGVSISGDPYATTGSLSDTSSSNDTRLNQTGAPDPDAASMWLSNTYLDVFIAQDENKISLIDVNWEGYMVYPKKELPTVWGWYDWDSNQWLEDDETPAFDSDGIVNLSISDENILHAIDSSGIIRIGFSMSDDGRYDDGSTHTDMLGVTVTWSPNEPPDLNLNSPNSGTVSEITQIDFNVRDLNNDELHVRIAATIFWMGPGYFNTNIISDLNLNDYASEPNLDCDDSDWTNSTNCVYHWDTNSGRDGNYYLDMNVWDSSNANDIDSSNSILVIDNFPDTYAIVTTASGATPATGENFQRRTWFDGTRYWASFWSSDSTEFQFWYSTDGNNWTENSNAALSDYTSLFFTVEADSSNAFLFYYYDENIYARKASSYPSTTFSWGEPSVVVLDENCPSFNYLSASKDTNSRLWLIYSNQYFPGSRIYVRRSTNANDITSWDSLSRICQASGYPLFHPIIAPMLDSKMYAIWGSVGVEDLNGKNFDGSDWNSTFTDFVGDYGDPSALGDSSGNIHLVYTDESDYVNYKKYSSGWNDSVMISNEDSSDPVISLDSSSGNLYVFWMDDNTDIFYAIGESPFSESDWSWPILWQYGGTNAAITSNYSTSSKIFVEWADTIGSPDRIKWDELLFEETATSIDIGNSPMAFALDPGTPDENGASNTPFLVSNTSSVNIDVSIAAQLLNWQGTTGGTDLNYYRYIADNNEASSCSSFDVLDWTDLHITNQAGTNTGVCQGFSNSASTNQINVGIKILAPADEPDSSTPNSTVTFYIAEDTTGANDALITFP